MIEHTDSNTEPAPAPTAADALLILRESAEAERAIRALQARLTTMGGKLGDALRLAQMRRSSALSYLNTLADRDPDQLGPQDDAAADWRDTATQAVSRAEREVAEIVERVERGGPTP